MDTLTRALLKLTFAAIVFTVVFLATAALGFIVGKGTDAREAALALGLFAAATYAYLDGRGGTSRG